MGKRPWIRIANRGSCPRDYLLYIGAGTKRDKVDDPKTLGWFGSGAKIAPIAALSLGLPVHVSSTDEGGKYHITYLVEESKVGENVFRHVVIAFHEDSTPNGGERIKTQFLVDSFMNWTKPIGDDTLKEYRFWREYFSNARGADPTAPHLAERDRPGWAPQGVTKVYLPKTADYEAIMANLSRYFKWMTEEKPLFAAPGVGEAYLKSEPGVTRMFGRGNLAGCWNASSYSSVLDYSLEDWTLMSEERTFENMGKVFRDVGLLLARCEQVGTAKAIIAAIADGKGWLEAAALSHVQYDDLFAPGADGVFTPTPACLAWRQAWHELRDKDGREAVISVGGFSDEWAFFSFKALPIKVESNYLERFLKLAGVRSSKDLMPDDLMAQIEEVALSAARQDIRDACWKALVEDYPSLKTIELKAFRPKTEAAAKSCRGFCWPPEPPITQVWMKETEYDLYWTAMCVLGHEADHVLSKAADGKQALVEYKDDELTRFRLARHDLPDDEPTDFDISVDEAATETQKSLAEVKKMSGTSKIEKAIEGLTLEVDKLDDGKKP